MYSSKTTFTAQTAKQRAWQRQTMNGQANIHSRSDSSERWSSIEVWCCHLQLPTFRWIHTDALCSFPRNMISLLLSNFRNHYSISVVQGADYEAVPFFQAWPTTTSPAALHRWFDMTSCAPILHSEDTRTQIQSCLSLEDLQTKHTHIHKGKTPSWLWPGAFSLYLGPSPFALSPGLPAERAEQGASECVCLSSLRSAVSPPVGDPDLSPSFRVEQTMKQLHINTKGYGDTCPKLEFWILLLERMALCEVMNMTGSQWNGLIISAAVNMVFQLGHNMSISAARVMILIIKRPMLVCAV